MGDESTGADGARRSDDTRPAVEAPLAARSSTRAPRGEPTGPFRTGGFGPARGTGTRAVGSTRIVSIRLRGAIDRDALHESLHRADESLDRLGRAQVMVDCRRVEGWVGDARDRLVKWARTQSDRVDRVAYVTDDVLWQMVLRTSSIASRQSLRGFSDIEDAFDWLSGH